MGGPPARALVDDDLGFEMAGLSGPRRLRVTRLPRGTALEAIRLNGADVTDQVLMFGSSEQSLSGVEIHLTTRVAGVNGVVSDGHGHAVDTATIIVFPVDLTQRYPQSRFVVAVRSDRTGSYRIDALPPGDYFVAAVDRETGRCPRRLDVRNGWCHRTAATARRRSQFARSHRPTITSRPSPDGASPIFWRDRECGVPGVARWHRDARDATDSGSLSLRVSAR